jgi:hypothetical protein
MGENIFGICEKKLQGVGENEIRNEIAVSYLKI